MAGIVDKVRAAGVVGAGGAGFPTHVKLDAKVELVLCNGASCEPLLESDPILMETRPGDVVRGMALAMEAVGAPKGLICIKKKYPEAIAALEGAISAAGLSDSLGVYLLDDFYPAGDEQVLVHEVTGKIVPEAGIPLQVGVVVSNTESLVNIAAADKGEPVVDRYLTVCGEVREPMVTKVPLGIGLREVIELAGGPTIGDYDILVGGPMMGAVAKSADEPVTKTTSGVILLPPGHYVTSAKVTDPERIRRLARIGCCQCSRCTDLCPRNLLGHSLRPHLIMRGLSGRPVMGGPSPIQEALICSECGVCEKYACPMMISPREVNAALKRELMGEGRRWETRQSEFRSSSFIKMRRIPGKRLIERLQVAKYDVHPHLKEAGLQPKKVVLPLKQHLGAPAEAVVTVGQKVQKGEVVGEIPEKALAARIHASISGTVTEVGDSVVITS